MNLMSRNEKILRHLNLNGLGIEIGPSHNPVAPKREGYKVEIIDHLSREDLVAKYRLHNVDLDKIEEVDFVWRGESYAELTGKKKHYDWIIASHVIEHTPDLISFLNDCDSILKDDGIISLVVPDKRYCFDHYRPITGISKIIDSYFSKNKIHTAGSVAEYFLNVVSKADNISWDSYAKGECKFVHDVENAQRGIQAVINDHAYLDIHAWCFVPHSFRLLIHDLFSLEFTNFQEIEYIATEGCEFYVTVGRGGKGINTSRLEMLEIIESELAAQ
jgi:SAM-dependent methyltransferase